ncbi:MAG: acyltransferase [Oscillospiraceae bacterium]|nr:acyltransferase [Oscillospiraceae bacterium]
MNKNNTNLNYQINHIDVLDGIRAVTILIIVWYHIWQQSWIMPVWGDVNIDWIPRNGAICVDMMILLSGFCLFLPYAKEMVYGIKTSGTKEFYLKRAARIMPSYYMSVLICFFIFALPAGEYSNSLFMAKDLASHIFFINNLWADTLVATKLNVVLWTVAVEMQFYIIFPFLARCFQKKPIITYSVMAATGLLSCFVISTNAENISMQLYVNHTLTFFCVFANGMLGAWAYMNFTKNLKYNISIEMLFTVLTFCGLYMYRIMCNNHTYSSNGQKWQVDNRFMLSLVFLLIVISILMAQKTFQLLLGNKIMKFIAGISFNLYIWHQYIAVKLKAFRIPHWQGDVPPNMLNDRVWMWKYQTLCFVTAFIAAVLATYLVEKPAAKIIYSKINNKLLKKDA